MTAVTTVRVNKVTLTDIHKHISETLNRARIDIGMNLSIAASDIGISANQLSKYERGINRIPAVFLWKLADLYKTDIISFFK